MAKVGKSSLRVVSTASHLAQLRQASGMTQRAVAKSLGVSPGNYNEMESGKRPLPAHHIPKLSELFSVSPRHLIAGLESRRLEKLRNVLSSHTVQNNDELSNQLAVYGLDHTSAVSILNLRDTTQMRHITRPDFLKAIPHSFIWILDHDALSPRYGIGDVLVVDPQTMPALQQDCVVQDDTGAVYVRRYAGSTDDYHFFIEQLTPKRTIRVKRPVIDGIYAIIGRFDRSFFDSLL